MIVVAGATGTLGPILVPGLTASHEPVRIATRTARPMDGPFAGADLSVGNICHIGDADRLLRGARVVVSAITGFASSAGVQAVDADGNRVLCDAAVRAGVEHLVLVSVSGAAPDHPIALFRAKYAAEQAVRSSGIAWTIIRPTAYLETWLGIIGQPLVRTGKTRIFGHGDNPINFVSAVDVARTIEVAIGDSAMRGKVVEMPGPENLTLDQLMQIVEDATGRKGRASHAPRAAMRVLSVALKPFNPMRAGQIASALVMDTTNMSVDGPAIRAGYPTIPVTTAAEVVQGMFAA